MHNAAAHYAVFSSRLSLPPFQTRRPVHFPYWHRPCRTPRHQQHTDQVAHPDTSNTETKSHTQIPATHRPSRTPRHQQHTDQVAHPDTSNTQTKLHTQTPATHKITVSRLTWLLTERRGFRLPAGARIFQLTGTSGAHRRGTGCSGRAHEADHSL